MMYYPSCKLAQAQSHPAAVRLLTRLATAWFQRSGSRASCRTRFLANGRPPRKGCLCTKFCPLLSFVQVVMLSFFWPGLGWGLGKERSCTCAPLEATSNDHPPDATARDLPFCSCIWIPTCIGTWTPTSCSGIEISCYYCYRIRSSLPLAHLYTWCYVVRPSLAPAKNLSCTFALAHLP